MAEKKKLLITGSTFPRWENDTEPRFILDYAKSMTKYYDVTVLVPAAIGAKSEEIMEGVHVVRYNYFPIHKWQTLCYPGAIVPRIKEKRVRILLVPFLMLALYCWLFRHGRNFDIVHAHWLIPQGIVQSFLNIPYIVTGHGGDVTSLNNGIMRKLKERCLRRAKAVTVVSKDLKQVVEGIVPGINAEIISMGCNTEIFSSNLRVENYFDQGNKKVVLFVGRLAEKKGVTYLIDAMKEVENAILVIVGKGNLENELKAQAQELGDKVKFLGPKTHDELPKIYASADIFVAPSITAKDGDKEGFGLVIIEAMASGLPVIASASGGITDIIEHGSNGMLVKEKDSFRIAESINLLLTQKDIYNKLSVASRETAEKFDYSEIARKYSGLLREFQGE